MTLKELKNNILNNKQDLSLLILKCKDDGSVFLAKSYCNKLAENHDIKVVYVDEMPVNSIWGINEDELSLYITKELSEEVDYDLKNCIIICNTISDNLTIDKEYIIEINSLEDWQVLDYVKYYLDGINEKDIEWLCSETKYNIHRLNLEIKRLSMHNKSMRQTVFDSIKNDNGFSDLNTSSIFDFSNALLHKDKNTLLTLLPKIKLVDVEPYGLLTILHNKFKNILMIQCNKYIQPEDLGITSKQLYAIKYNECNIYSNNQIQTILECLSTIDYKLKNGDLPYENIVDYILIKVLGEID